MTSMTAMMGANIWTRALTWPVIAWVVINVVFFGALAIVPDMGKAVSPAGLTPLLLLVGLWAGYKIVEFGGNIWYAAAAGVVVGLVCAILDIIGSALVLKMSAGDAYPGSVYFFGMNFFGAVVGGGFKLTK